ncbi:MAG: ammonium transporter [Zoogloeaceae bacterium]|jgi:Amt family ammonium transporter|nr:ammonium transporter [Zoogloeaceae bacterium]
MKAKLFAFLCLCLSLFFAGGALAQELVEVVIEEAVPTLDSGDTAWILTSTALVMMMSIPGIALFYGGMVRTKNMLSVLMQVFVVFSMITILWVVYGYSLAFTESNAFIGGLGKALLCGITIDSLEGTLPELLFVSFQGAFAAITAALILGSFAERIRFSAALVYIALWFTFAYLPICHMVWFGGGEAGIAGWLSQYGALDFAGGTVVHINAAVAGLVGAYFVGKRIGYGREALTPHSVTLTMVGASLLWIGWFGFNGGSAVAANGEAALAYLNTWVATSAATLSWVAAEWKIKGKPSMLGAASGAIAGLVAITPAGAFVGVSGALIIGLLAGVICLWGVNGLKRMLGVDDSLDVFGVHGVGGILGAILTGVFAAPALGGSGGEDFLVANQVIVQALSVGVTIVWCGVVSAIALKVVDVTIGLRVPEEEERQGLDITTHGESAYHY